MRDELNSLLADALARRPESASAVAVDFETYYCTPKGALRRKRAKLGGEVCTVETTGNWGYCRHPEWEAYMVSIYAPDVQFVGDPRSAPWDRIKGRTWVSHNRNFDRHVYERVVELGQAPWVDWDEWHDSADLAVYSHLPRALVRAVKEAFRIELDKGARTSMDGVRWSEVAAGDRERILTYALEDAATCWLLWAEKSPSWPEHERAVSLHTGEIEFRGIPVDVAGVDQDMAVLRTAEWAAKQKIPWFDDVDEKGKPVALMSRKAFDRECMKACVPLPKSTAAKDPDFLEWVDEYGDKVPAVLDLGRYRRITRTIAVYEALKARIRPDGRAALGLKYFGADKTGRWSGAAKFNLQNLMKQPLLFTADYGWSDDAKTAAYKVDVRSRIVAPAGRTLVIADLSQIEPRVLNWVVGNREFLDLCAQGMSPYEAHARASMGWTGGNLKKQAAQKYALAKARVLALGYGAGWGKFITMARGYLGSEEEFNAIFAAEPPLGQTDLFLLYLRSLSQRLGHDASKKALELWPTLTEQERNIWVNSWCQVQDFRATNPKIKSLWEALDAGFKSSTDTGIFENELPSGRTLKYFDVTPHKGWTAKAGNPYAIPQRTYGAHLVENMIQALARDCFVHGILNLEAAGHCVLFHVHDEVIVETDPTTDPKEIVRLMTTMPAWAGRLPVAAEAEVSSHYKK